MIQGTGIIEMKECLLHCLGCDERVSRSHSRSLNVRDNIPKTALEVCKDYMISYLLKKLFLDACLMLVLRPKTCKFLHS
jgi:hypothetical protein